MLSIIDRILGVAARLLGLSDSLAKADKERRERAGKLFLAVASCLEHVAETFQAGQVPHGACSELQTYARLLPEAIGTEVGLEQAERLAGELEAAHNVEAVMMAVGADPKLEVAKIWEAAGRFQALGNLLG